MSELDNLAKIKEIDQDNLANLMKELPKQLESVWQEKDKINFPNSFHQVKNVIISGMGCDRIVADVLKKSLEEISPLPIEVVGDYNTASYINEETLIIPLSYSGLTLEVLSFVKKILALKKRPKIFAIIGGGKLEEIAQKENFPFYKFSGYGASRGNIGYLIFALALLLEKIGLFKEEKKYWLNFIEKVKKLNEQCDPKISTDKNPAKNLAYKIFDRAPIILGAQHLWPTAQRFKKLFNENSKNFSFAEEVPEFFHNSVVGIDHPFRLKDEVFFISLESNFYDQRIKVALSLFKEELKKRGFNSETINYPGQSKFEEAFLGIVLGDWTTYYLAILNQTAPAPMILLEAIKNQIRKI